MSIKIAADKVSYEAMQALMDISSEGIWDWDARTGHVYRNEAWYQMLDYVAGSLEATVLTWESLIHEDDFERVMALFDDCIHGRTEMYVAEYRIRTQSGHYMWIRDTGKVVEWTDDGHVARMMGAHSNINDKKLLVEQFAKKSQSLEALVEERTNELRRVNSELEKRVNQVQHLAETDALTGVANRYRLEKTLKLEVERAHRFNHPLSIMAMDLDDFKDINDLYGHACGDLVLIELAKLIQNNLREIDLVARWGGDEFMVVLPHTTLQAALLVAEKILILLRDLSFEKDIKASVSMGIVELRHDESAMRLSIRADNALYASKASGKDTISLDKEIS